MGPQGPPRPKKVNADPADSKVLTASARFWKEVWQDPLVRRGWWGPMTDWNVGSRSDGTRRAKSVVTGRRGHRRRTRGPGEVSAGAGREATDGVDGAQGPAGDTRACKGPGGERTGRSHG